MNNYICLVNCDNAHEAICKLFPNNVGQCEDYKITNNHYPFQATERESEIKSLFDKLLKNFQSYKSNDLANKNAWYNAFIQGMNGIGKTRFLLELLKLFEKESKKEEKYNFEPYINELRETLCDAKVCVIDFGNNGNQLIDKELNLQPEVIFGLRLAYNYWNLNQGYNNESSSFTLCN